MIAAGEGATGTTLTHLEGAMSGESYPADELMGLDPEDGRPLFVRYDLEKAARTLTAESLAKRRTGGLWRRAELLPVRERNHIVYLGEGDTPLLSQGRLGEALGVPRLATKAEGLNPTGSFKARGMAVAVSEDSISEMQTFAGRLGAGYVSPESAAALAAVPALRDKGDVERNDEIVVFDCGIGQKYPPPKDLPEPPVVDPDDLDIAALADTLA